MSPTSASFGPGTKQGLHIAVVREWGKKPSPWPHCRQSCPGPCTHSPLATSAFCFQSPLAVCPPPHCWFFVTLMPCRCPCGYLVEPGGPCVRVCRHGGLGEGWKQKPGVGSRAQLNCPELSFLFSRKCIIQEPPTALALAAQLSGAGMRCLSR